MEEFSRDINEIMDILSVSYGDGDSMENADSVSRKMSAETDNEYLNQRGEAIKSAECLRTGFSMLYDNRCKRNDCDNCPVRKYCNSYIRYRIENYDREAPVMVDFFCGAGGLSLGFTQNGFVTSLANDIEPCCVDTYAHNHPEIPRENIVLGDINTVIEQLPSLLRFKDVDIVVGGPPCQGFSMANRQRLIDDPRNHLYKSFVRAISSIKPRFFVMENVKGMLPVSGQVVEDFEKIGYTVSRKVLNAKDFGVPQNRERLIYIGNRCGVDNDQIFADIMEKSGRCKSYVLRDAISDLRPLEASRTKSATEIGTEASGYIIERWKEKEQSAYIQDINQGKPTTIVFNHKARYNNDRDIEIFSRLEQGDKSDDPKIADIMPYSRRNGIFKDKYYKLEEDKVCKTITAHMKFDCNMYIHPKQARGLTPREAARVQSYPDDYFFRGAYTKTYMQIGNSVPPLLGRTIASVLKGYIEQSRQNH